MYYLNKFLNIIDNVIKMGKDPLYSNSFFIMGTRFITSFSGFIFWFIATKYFSSNEIGEAVGLISTMGLIMNFSIIGLNYGLIRYIPIIKNKSIFINSLMNFTILLSILISSIFILFNILLKTRISEEYNIFIIINFLFYIINNIILFYYTNSFISIRKSKYSFLINAIFASRIIFIPFLFPLGYIGLIMAFEISFILVTIIGYFLLKRFGINIKVICNINYIKKIFKFSIHNYISNFSTQLLPFLLPILVIIVLDTQETAYFFIAYKAAIIVNILPHAIFSSLFVEGSHKEKSIKLLIKKSLFMYIIFFIPFLIIYAMMGKIILNIFDTEYGNNSLFIYHLILLSVFLSSIIQLYFTIMRIMKRTQIIMIISIIMFVLTCFSSIILMSINNNISGIGYGLIITNIIVIALIIIISLCKK